MSNKTEKAALIRPGDVDAEFAPLNDDVALRGRVERQINKKNEFLISFGVYVVVTLGLVVLFAGLGILWIAGVVALGWGAGVAAHGIDTWYQTGRRAANRLALIHQAFRADYGPHWDEVATVRQLKEIRRRVDEPINKRKEFFMHLAVYLCIIPMLWLISANIAIDFLPWWPAIVMILWGAGLAWHGLDTIHASRHGSAIEREMERQRVLMDEAQWGREKPKNERRDAEWAVADDGELSENVQPDARQNRR